MGRTRVPNSPQELAQVILAQFPPKYCHLLLQHLHCVMMIGFDRLDVPDYIPRMYQKGSAK
jgi:hypothetical protein